jgi:dethiobiotin synthetase
MASKQRKLFVTGIGTDVGKTIASAILVEALQADYWKPIQAGDLDHSDSIKVSALLSNSKSHIFENSYKLNTPASPHYAAQLDGITIDLSQIKEPKTANHLVIEGAGGLLVPLNDTACIIDLIQKDYEVILVSRHYLGSINHTLLSLEALKSRNIPCAGIIFSGDENPATEAIILSKSGVKCIGRINNEPYFDANVIAYYADKFRDALTNM